MCRIWNTVTLSDENLSVEFSVEFPVEIFDEIPWIQDPDLKILKIL